MEWTTLKLLTSTSEYLKKKNIPSYRLDTELLLARALGYTRVTLYTHFDQPVTAFELEAFRQMVNRRAAREPVAYILGTREFWGLSFQVGPGVLVPRPDTESLVEEAVRLLGGARKKGPTRRSLPWQKEPVGSEGSPASPLPGEETSESTAGASAVSENAPVSAPAPESLPLVLDLCTGSGIIPICLAKETGARAIGVDISPVALTYARKNIEMHELGAQVALLQGDLAAPVPRRFHRRFDLLTANPPYLRDGDVEDLEPEVSVFEPRLALAAGPEGLDLYAPIIDAAGDMLRPGGWILLEIGNREQGDIILEMLSRGGYLEGALLPDLSGQVRLVRARTPD